MEEYWEHEVIVKVLVFSESDNPEDAKKAVIEQIGPHFADVEVVSATMLKKGD